MVKLSICLPWIRCTGKEEVQFLSFSTSASLPGCFNPWNTMKKGCVGPTAGLNILQKKILPLARCKPWSSSSWYCHYTDWAVPTPKIIWSNHECVIYITTFSVSVCVCVCVGVLIFYRTITFCHFLPHAWVGNVTRWMKLKDGRESSSPNTRHYPSIFSVGNEHTTKNCSQTWGLGRDLNLKHSEQTAGLLTTQLISGRQKLNPTF